MSDSTLLSTVATHCIHCNDTFLPTSALLVCKLCKEEIEEVHEPVKTKTKKHKKQNAKNESKMTNDSSHPLAEGDNEWYYELRRR